MEALNRQEPASDKLGWAITARSAATLAFLSGRTRTAERLALQGSWPTTRTPRSSGSCGTSWRPSTSSRTTPPRPNAVLAALHGAIDAAVAEEKAAPVTYSETYTDVDYDPAASGVYSWHRERGRDKGLRGAGQAIVRTRTARRGRGQQVLNEWKRVALSRPPAERRAH